MSKITTKTVAELVSNNTNLARIFEKYQIDYCCGGNITLEQICKSKGLSLAELTNEIEAGEAVVEQSENANNLTSLELIEHIINQHHSYLRAEFPRLQMLLERVVKAHAENHPELIELQQLYLVLVDELNQHMQKEEMVLFPAMRDGEPMILAEPIMVMEKEHDNAGSILSRMRQLSNNYKLPSDACNSYKVLLQGLADMALDLHVHIHKENHLLFPKFK